MAREIHRLTARTVNAAKRPGYLADGGGLYLQVAAGGSKSWVFRFMLAGRSREMGLGSVNTVSLSDARQQGTDARKLLRRGVDPIEDRARQKAAQRLQEASSKTFKECAKAYIAAHQAGWKNPKHAAQWPSTLESYVYPEFGDLPASAVDTAMVMRVLEPIWTAKPETASRVRGRIESVLDWATVHGYRSGDNPARWRGHLQALLPAKGKVQKVSHHAALPYAELPEFMEELRGMDGVSPRALEFAILTAARTGETIGARWPEVDIGARLWTIPTERMKSGREHRVPLSDRAMAIMQSIDREKGSEYVFPGGRERAPLSNMALLTTLRRMKRGDLTAHGFRSTFSDWCAEQTAFPAELREMALAHVVGNKVEAAYRRGDLFEKRRRLMNAWGKYCTSPSRPGAKVVSIR